MKNNTLTAKYVAFYRSFYEAIEELPKSRQLDLYKAAMEYVFKHKEPNLSKMTKPQRAVWKTMPAQLDASASRLIKNMINGYKGAEYGKLGGRPRKNQPKMEENLEFEDLYMTELQEEIN